MKKLVGFPITWILFYIGHLISLTWETRFNRSGRGYSLYNWCMITSCKVQDWAGLEKPWVYPISKDKQNKLEDL